MQKKNKPICIIGARKGSKRLPNKNRLCINGKPLFLY
ncbi:Acylneuraminate cytidylyltransferase, partial [Candidatus Magnetomorum sp. HK-1]